ncbi:hypothetical protein [Chryseobacterium sp. JUb7]|nr:hypothetical protein [Chryseobacterium sp. JUb7]MCS3532132.1 hypothetical protein [Chryseobacterium sp. JUb7]
MKLLIPAREAMLPAPELFYNVIARSRATKQSQTFTRNLSKDFIK